MSEQPACPVEFWRLRTVMVATGFSRSELYRQIADGRFPKPRKYRDTNKSFWVSIEVLNWQRDQVGDDFEDLLL